MVVYLHTEINHLSQATYPRTKAAVVCNHIYASVLAPRYLQFLIQDYLYAGTQCSSMHIFDTILHYTWNLSYHFSSSLMQI